MNTNKARVRTGETTTVSKFKEMEIDIDYTQIYSCFNELAPKIKSVTSFKLLFWLLANKTNKSNSIQCGKSSFLEFNQFLEEKDPTGSVSEQTYYSCLSELVKTGIIKKHARNNYAANIFVIWKDKLKNRLNLIQHNSNTGDDVFENPLVTLDSDDEIWVVPPKKE